MEFGTPDLAFVTFGTRTSLNKVIWFWIEIREAEWYNFLDTIFEMTRWLDTIFVMTRWLDTICVFREAEWYNLVNPKTEGFDLNKDLRTSGIWFVAVCDVGDVRDNFLQGKVVQFWWIPEAVGSDFSLISQNRGTWFADIPNRGTWFATWLTPLDLVPISCNKQVAAVPDLQGNVSEISRVRIPDSLCDTPSGETQMLGSPSWAQQTAW